MIDIYCRQFSRYLTMSIHIMSTWSNPESFRHMPPKLQHVFLFPCIISGALSIHGVT